VLHFILELAKPYSLFGPHATNNGLLLRADLHKLFDNHYITITPDLYVEVSSRIKEEYDNGREYYQMHGKKLMIIPEKDSDKPSQEYLEWHNNLFVC
jgi:putative restriction endonuclease